MITISSKDKLAVDEETGEFLQENNPAKKSDGLFPENNRCLVFNDKKVVFLTSRVHPGETPGSHALNGFIDLLTE